MPRPALHATDDLLDAARELILEAGPRSVGIRHIAERSGAPSGSLYHRFRSRDNLVALAWLRAVRRFQDGFVAALQTPEPRGAVREAVRWSVEFALASPGDTRLLLCYSQADLLDATPAVEVLAELAAVNDALERALRALARRLFGSAGAVAVERTTYAVIDLPYAALRRHVLAGTLSRRTVGTLQAAVLAIVDHKEAP
jgi:AcrR family transcriptional regulator